MSYLSIWYQLFTASQNKLSELMRKSLHSHDLCAVPRAVAMNQLPQNRASQYA
jgi:hypothetical protein